MRVGRIIEPQLHDLTVEGADCFAKHWHVGVPKADGGHRNRHAPLQNSAGALGCEHIVNPCSIRVGDNPVSLGAFACPDADYFGNRLRTYWVAPAEDYVGIKIFFNRLAVTFSTDASDEVLNSQASLVFRRIPKHFRR